MSALRPKADIRREAIYSITSSGCTSSVFGILSPSALADLRLINNSTFVPCWTGRSRGFSPLRIRSSVHTGLTVSVEEIRAIAHQTAGRDELTGREDCRHRVADGQCCELLLLTDKKWIAANHESPARNSTMCAKTVSKSRSVLAFRTCSFNPNDFAAAPTALVFVSARAGESGLMSSAMTSAAGTSLAQQLQPDRRYRGI